MVWDMVCKKIFFDDSKEIIRAHRPKHALENIRCICNDFPTLKPIEIYNVPYWKKPSPKFTFSYLAIGKFNKFKFCSI